MSNKFRSSYNTGERSYSTIINGESMTEQSHAKETDVNLIVKSYQSTGTLSSLNALHGEFNHISSIVLQDALNAVMTAESAFSDLPSKLRELYDNDPVKLLSAFDNPSDSDVANFAQFGFAGIDGVAEPPSEAAPQGAASVVSEPPQSTTE